MKWCPIKFKQSERTETVLPPDTFCMYRVGISFISTCDQQVISFLCSSDESPYPPNLLITVLKCLLHHWGNRYSSAVLAVAIRGTKQGYIPASVFASCRLCGCHSFHNPWLSVQIYKDSEDFLLDHLSEEHLNRSIANLNLKRYRTEVYFLKEKLQRNNKIHIYQKYCREQATLPFICQNANL